MTAQDLYSFLPLLAILAVFWLLMIRPASRRQKQLRELQAALTPGDRVMLSSGFLGTVRSLGDERVEIELAPGTVVTVARGAVASRVEEPAVTDPGAPDEAGQPGPAEQTNHPDGPDAPERG